MVLYSINFHKDNLMAISVDERKMKLGAVPIAGININTKSRDDISRILGVCNIFTLPEIFEKESPIF